ncbi:hypothetical protein Plhal304r1_c061g0148601 [Plasmopara halstedii]
MRKRSRLTTAKPLHASNVQPTNSHTNWEKARDTLRARLRPKKRAREERTLFDRSKGFLKNNEEGRRRGCKDEAREESRKNNATFMILDAEIEAFAARVTLSPQERQLRMSVFHDMRDLISSAYQDATIQLYGSSSTRLETFRSDLDVTVGNIALSSSLILPSVAEVEESPAYKQLHVETGIENNCAYDMAEINEVASSFSLNLALPLDVVASKDNTDVKGRTQPATSSHWNPARRKRKLRVLRALQLLLKEKRPHFQVKCLHRAKVPILMVLDTKTKLSIDIGVNRELFETSDHGRSTSLVQRLINSLGTPFTTIIVFLKEFLQQFELNKPFTGGLGSFRLYIMVAHVFRREFSQLESLSSLLLAFFGLFGNKKKPNFLHEGTKLPLPLGSGGHLRFGSVFRIRDCVEVFAMAHDILSSTGKIGSIINEERFEEDRKNSQRDIRKQLSLFDNSKS